MKKIVAAVLAVLMVLSVSVLFAHAADTAQVYVTIADKEGKLPVAMEKVTVTDIDGDSTLTINDALYAAHEQFYEGGAAAGYATGLTQYGLSLTKLWGTAQGYSYGYMVNNNSAWSMTDPVAEGDYVAAYVFTDTKNYADKYAYFDKQLDEAFEAGEVTLQLKKNDFDKDWNPVTLPVAGAEITVDGVGTGIVTDNDGKATVTLDKNGDHIVSAAAADQVIVPPVFRATVVGGEAAPAQVYVTIADKEGKLPVAMEKVTVTDIDGDSTLTINDALYAAHEQFYEGGAAVGYATGLTQYGLSLTKLWGTAQGYSYGYMVNNNSAWSMTDPVAEGDHVAAYVFTDTKNYADKYAYFDKQLDENFEAGEVTLQLKKNDFDKDWNPVTLPVAGAEITVDGVGTGIFTDNNGNATVTLDINGEHIVSAAAADQVIVPPVFRATVAGGRDAAAAEPTEDGTEPTEAGAEPAGASDATEPATEPATKDSATKDSAVKNGSSPKTGDSTNMGLWLFITLASVLGAGVTVLVYKKRYEK